MNPVPILHIIDHLGLGGVQTLLQAILPPLRAAGFAPEVLNLRGETPISHALCAAGVPVHSLNLPKWSPRQFPALFEFLQTRKPTLVHTHLTVASLLGRAAATACGVPHIIMEEQVSLSQDVYGVPPVIVLAYRLWEPLLARRTALYLGPSQIVLDASMQAKHWPAERCMVRPNAVDCIRFAPAADRKAARADLGLPERVTVATFGRFVAQKRITDAVELARRIIPRHPDLQFVIAGGGPQEDEIRAAIGNAGLNEHVHLLGRRSDTDRILRACDIYLSVSAGEVLSLAILEAMASGCAVIATRAGGTAEQVSHGQTGFLTAVGDLDGLQTALVTLLNNAQQRTQFGEQGRMVALERYDVPVIVAAQAAIYRMLLAS